MNKEFKVGDFVKMRGGDYGMVRGWYCRSNGHETLQIIRTDGTLTECHFLEAELLARA